MSQQLCILQINDTHAYLEPHQELFWEGDQAVYREAGGYARIATLFSQARAEHPDAVIALDNGDTIHGTYAGVHSRGEAFIEPLNALGLDGMTAHWEFAYGPAQFGKVVQALHYPMLAINCYHQDSDELVFPPYRILERAGLRIGVIGIAATIIDKTMPPHFSTGLRFTLGRDELPGHIRHLRETENVDLIVVLSHLGFPQEVKLAEQVDGIDVLLSGHTHNRVYDAKVINGAIIMQSGCHGSFVGRLDLEIEAGKIREWRHRLLVVDQSIPPDPAMQQLIDGIMAPHRAMLDRVVGHTATALNRNTVLEATMDNLLLQAIAEAAGTGIAFSNGWRYGAPVIPGPMTMNDLWNIVPTNPPISVVELSGRELWDMMEENLERTFACDPYQQMGGYVKRCLGVNIYIKVENKPGLRIQRFFVDGELLDPERSYTCAFITEQGVPAKYGSNRRHLEIHAIEALERYLARHDPANANLHGSVVAV